jgi:hypothetical protein
MARKSVDELLAHLDNLNFGTQDEETFVVLKKCLSSKSSLVVAKTAKLCADHHLSQLNQELVQTFRYFVEKAEKDKGCYAKKAIVKTLYELDFINTEFYTEAISVRQMEPVWGGSVDSAFDVRCWAANGLTLSTNVHIIFQLLELLHDTEPQARLGAVKAIAYTNPMHANILIREKILDGDEETYIIGECFHQLMIVDPDTNLEFVKAYLAHNDEEWVEYAALAIAAYNDLTAFEVLKEAIEQAFYDSKKRHLIKAMALHRSKHTVDYLLVLLESAGSQEVDTIIEALAIYRTNDKIRQQVQTKIDGIDSQNAIDAFEKYWNQ